MTTEFTGPANPLGVETDEDDIAFPIMVDSNQSVPRQWTLQSNAAGLYRIGATGPASGAVLMLEQQGEEYGPILSVESPDPADADLWQITPLGDGYCRLSPFLLGTGQSLDIVNNDVDRELKIAASGDFSGQNWLIEVVTGDSADENLDQCSGSNTEPSNDPAPNSFVPTAQYRSTTMRGFQVFVNPALDESGQLGVDAIAELDAQLLAIQNSLGQQVLAQLRQIPVWLELDQVADSAGQFHPSEQWLINNGYNPDKAGAVEISNARVFLQDARQLNVSVALHEFAHSRQFYLIDNSSLPFEATYQQAVDSGMYESVAYITGSNLRAYALTDHHEYFAELSEAYLGTNDFYPFNRTELQTFDPAGYELVRQAWMD